MSLIVCLSDAYSMSHMLAAQTALPLILAQSGAAKTAVGWVIVLLLLLLALLVVARPSGRKMPEGDKKR